MLQTTTNSKLILAITAFITFTCHSSINQLVTSTVQTPQQLVQNVLLGSGVTVSNITYTGHPDAIGEFDGSNCNIGFNAGLVLTTGTVLDTSPSGIQNGPFGPNDSPSSASR